MREPPTCPACGRPERGFVCSACGGAGFRHGCAEIVCPYCRGTGVWWRCPAYLAPDGRPVGEPGAVPVGA